MGRALRIAESFLAERQGVERIAAAWPLLVPLSSFALLVIAMAAGVGPLLAVLCGVGIAGTVLVSVHHAEIVAHRVGEPFGTLVLAVSVTVIEASLILSMMLADSGPASVLPRDTIYAAVMIICNGVIGICVLLGGLAHREQSFRVEGAGAGLAVLIVLSALTLALPAFGTAAPGHAPAGVIGTPMLVFVATASAVLWAVFIFVQTVRHRDYFLPVRSAADPEYHARPPTAREAWMSFGLLLVSLVAVVGLAKKLSPTIEHAVDVMGAPQAAIGIVIAILVLLPETGAAVRAARADRLQTSMNLAIGSALACIGLTVPVVVVTSIAAGLPLVLGLEPKALVLLAVTFLVSTVTLGTGRTYIMQGAVHLVIFAAFLFLALGPS
ncbi:MAG: ionic transporter y4hA [Alphaproteobacteria bacterium]|nr:ionic transporter y4hA [Alphaproteobacteria bacterium]